MILNAKWQKFDVIDIDKHNTDRSVYTIMNIYKLKDEWYIVCDEQDDDYDYICYYKCDQIDGLLKCLEDIYLED